MGNAQDVVDLLEAETKDAGAGGSGALGMRPGRIAESVEEFERDIGLDESDSEQLERLDRCRAIELEATENLAGKIEWALRYGP